MTIEEIKQAKRVLETNVLDQLEAFRRATGLTPRRVALTHYMHRPLETEFGDEIVGQVRVEVDLGC